MANPLAGYWTKLYKGTAAEYALEPAVASLGVVYRWQYPFWLFGPLKYIADFLLPDHKVVLEVDDPSHFTPAGRAKDKIRTAALVRAGYRVVRCTNDEALADPYGTVDRMCEAARLSLRTARTPRQASR